MFTGVALTGVIALAPTTAGASPASSADGPTVQITSPGPGAAIAPGNGTPGHGSTDGSGFVLNIRVVTHDAVGLSVNEGLNIRHTDALGGPNPDFPGLNVTVDNDLTAPDGHVIGAGTNLAPLFNVAGSDDTPGPGVTVWAGWHVLESLAPGSRELTINVSVTDNAGRVGTAWEHLMVTGTAGSGQALTPPAGVLTGNGVNDSSGPLVSLEAPETPTSVALGTLPQPTLTNGTLFFIQLNATDRSHDGIGVNVNGPGTGLIVDPTQIGAQGPNRNFPGLDVTFDVALRQPNGNLVPAGQNLAPLFNIAGSELVPNCRGELGDRNDGHDSLNGNTAVRIVADWVVGGSLVIPAGQKTVTITAKVTDNANRTGSTSIRVGISPVTSGQGLTP